MFTFKVTGHNYCHIQNVCEMCCSTRAPVSQLPNSARVVFRIFFFSLKGLVAHVYSDESSAKLLIFIQFVFLFSACAGAPPRTRGYQNPKQLQIRQRDLTMFFYKTDGLQRERERQAQLLYCQPPPQFRFEENTNSAPERMLVLVHLVIFGFLYLSFV